MPTPYPFQSGATLLASQMNSLSQLPTVSITSNSTAVATHAYSRVIANGSAITYTIPNNVFEAGQVIEFHNINSTACTIAAGAGVTLNAAAGLTVSQYQAATIYATSASSFILFESDVTAAAQGLTFITSSTFSAVASVSVNDCFSSTYNNYRVIVSAASASLTGNQTLAMRMRVGGSDNTANNYNWARFVVFNGGTAGAGATAASFEINGGTAYTNLSIALDVIDPQTTNRTQILGHSLANQNDNLALVGFNGGVMTVTTSYTGFTLFPSSGTFSGEIAVYGYRKA